jgi:hypothetical protein
MERTRLLVNGPQLEMLPSRPSLGRSYFLVDVAVSVWSD